MKRAHGGMWIGLVAVAAAGVGLLAWREQVQAGVRLRLEAELAALRADLAAEAAGRGEMAQALESAGAKLAAGELERGALTDRVGNLEAQRDHLRAEQERQAERARRAEEAVAAMQAEVETARQQALANEALPAELSGKLGRAQARIADLEAQLDGQAAMLAGSPASMAVAGVSADAKVFALDGDMPAGLVLPAAVHVCRSGAIVLDGWIHRQEGGLLVGHVERWREGASALVNGEKVFMLPRTSHEAYR